MSFHISFFARDVASAQEKLREAHAPSAVKALIELSLAGITRAQSGFSTMAAPPVQAPWPRGSKAAFDEAKAMLTAPVPPRRPSLCGVQVEAIGHIDENGHRSNIGSFKVEPLFD